MMVQLLVPIQKHPTMPLLDTILIVVSMNLMDKSKKILNEVGQKSTVFFWQFSICFEKFWHSVFCPTIYLSKSACRESISVNLLFMEEKSQLVSENAQKFFVSIIYSSLHKNKLQFLSNSYKI